MPNCDIRSLSKPDEGSKGTDNFQLQANFSVHFGIILKPLAIQNQLSDALLKPP